MKTGGAPVFSRKLCRKEVQIDTQAKWSDLPSNRSIGDEWEPLVEGGTAICRQFGPKMADYKCRRKDYKEWVTPEELD